MTSEKGSPGATASPDPAATANGHPRKVQEVESITIRFAGDSGDGMQLAGTQFTNTSALLGNDIASGVILIRVDYESVNHVEIVAVATSSQVFWHRHFKSQQRARLNSA